MTENIDRRDFIKSTAAGALGAGFALRASSTSGRALGANDRVAVGFIGLGRMGQSNLKDFLAQQDVDVAAVCDVYAPNLDKAAAMAPKADRQKDFRRIIDRKDIDVLVVSTPDHWHALPTIMACQAEKDVYVEKPLSHTIDEGRRMVQAARKYNRVVQVGTQQRSGKHFQKAVELVSSGAIGKISFVRAWNFGNQYPKGIGNPADSDPPHELDWDLWLGPAPKVRFNANRFGVNPDNFSYFRWFWDYAGGMVTDWGIHLLDIVQWGMGADYPQAVSATGGKLYLQDNRETPDTLIVTYEYPGWMCTYENRECNGSRILDKGYGITFHGTDGTLFVDRRGFEILPETRRASDDKTINRMEPMKEANSNDQHLTHVRNFLDSVKSRKNPISDIEIGHRSTSTALLANISYRTRRRIVWDGQNERIVGDHEASRLLSRAYRKPWSLNP